MHSDPQVHSRTQLDVTVVHTHAYLPLRAQDRSLAWVIALRGAEFSLQGDRFSPPGGWSEVLPRLALRCQ